MAWEGEGGDYNWRKKADDEHRKLLAANRNWEADSAWGLMAGALRHEPHMDIVGKALEDIANDSVVNNFQEDLVQDIENDPRYGIEDFVFGPKTRALTFGETGNMLQDAALSQTWTVRAANVDVNVKVTQKKEATFEYQLNDKYDLRPDWHSGARKGGSGFFYNLITTVLGGVWHDFLGASDQMTTSAFWYSAK